MSLQDPLDDPAAVAAREAAGRYHVEMDALLSDRDYLAGPYSFADIAFYMAQVFGARMGAAVTEATPNLVRWRDRMTERAAVQTVLVPMVRFLAARARPVPLFLQHLLSPMVKVRE